MKTPPKQKPDSSEDQKWVKGAHTQGTKERIFPTAKVDHVKRWMLSKTKKA